MTKAEKLVETLFELGVGAGDCNRIRTSLTPLGEIDIKALEKAYQFATESERKIIRVVLDLVKALEDGNG